MLTVLAEAGLESRLVVEVKQNPANANPLKYANMAREFLRTHLEY